MGKKQENYLLLRRFLLVACCNAVMGFGLANMIAATQSDSTTFTVHKETMSVTEIAGVRTVGRQTPPYSLASL